MSLRTTGLIAGVIGVILLIVGFVADSVRPPEDVVAHADVSTSVVVVQSDFLTISPEGTLSIEGDGDIVAYTARPADAEAWLAEVDYTEVNSLPDWEALGTRDVAVPSPTPSPEPSSSASASASAAAEDDAKEESPSPSPSPEEKESSSASPSPSASPEPAIVPTEADPFIATEGRSTDLWRNSFIATNRLDIAVDSVPTGLTLVVMTEDGSALTGTDLSLTRVVNDDWITPLLWWGAVLVVVGLIALVVLFIDLRPAQARGESWMASRSADKKGIEKDGSRRSRRAAGAAIPQASLDDAPALTADAATPVDGAEASVDAESSADASSEPEVDSADGGPQAESDSASGDEDPHGNADSDFSDSVKADDDNVNDSTEGGPDDGPAPDGTEDRS
ncbi:hypothetical protein [Demequina aurantiaca]|uniref:hypothetical protein n=1 Tax=Demequina aurantiaca TaxID=676200 RepID=UPI00128B5737|nr:hypothetical protein [Demequina aurantiaca]